MKLLPSLFKNRQSPDRPWQWPLCGTSKTPSFRAPHHHQIFTTLNSTFFHNFLSDPIHTPDSWFANSSLFESARVSLSTEFEDDLELVIQGAKSERLIFEPGETNSILDQSRGGKSEGGKCESILRFEGSVVVLMAMESEDPYLDFRRSMEEMVECHGIRNWEWLEELLNWYLRMNGMKNHGYILGAFVDLLVDLGGADGSTDSTSIFSDDLIIQPHDRERCVV